MFIKICLILIGLLAVFGIGICIGVVICLIAVEEMIPPSFPNYWAGQKNKKKDSDKI